MTRKTRIVYVPYWYESFCIISSSHTINKLWAAKLVPSSLRWLGIGSPLSVEYWHRWISFTHRVWNAELWCFIYCLDSTNPWLDKPFACGWRRHKTHVTTPLLQHVCNRWRKCQRQDVYWYGRYKEIPEPCIMLYIVSCVAMADISVFK